MNIELFVEPTEHPYEMLAGLRLRNTMECERVLVWILTKCISTGRFGPVVTKYTHPSLVEAGLLREISTRKYELTRKAKGYLYAYYGVEEE